MFELLFRQRSVDHIIGVWSLIGGVILIVSSCITVASILLREMDLSPIEGDSELQSFTNLICFFFFLPYSIRANVHTRINLLNVPQRFESIRKFLVLAVWICFLLIMLISMTTTMVTFLEEKTISMSLGIQTGILIPPILASIILSFAACFTAARKSK